MAGSATSRPRSSTIPRSGRRWSAWTPRRSNWWASSTTGAGSTTQEADLHCTRGLGIWAWAGTEATDGAEEPDVVLACVGDIPTMETLAAAALLRERLP
jgi:hypothetical protein